MTKKTLLTTASILLLLGLTVCQKGKATAAITTKKTTTAINSSSTSKEKKESLADQEPMKSAKYTLQGKVIRVADGDTFTLLAQLENKDGSTEKRKIKVRSYGIDAPESDQPFGNKSKEFLANQILNKEILVYVITKDQYGRTIGIAVHEGKNINYETIKAGYAWHYKTYDKSKSFDKYAKAEEEARAKKIGLWKDPNPKKPWEWRKENREKNGNRR